MCFFKNPILIKGKKLISFYQIKKPSMLCNHGDIETMKILIKKCCRWCVKTVELWIALVLWFKRLRRYHFQNDSRSNFLPVMEVR